MRAAMSPAAAHNSVVAPGFDNALLLAAARARSSAGGRLWPGGDALSRVPADCVRESAELRPNGAPRVLFRVHVDVEARQVAEDLVDQRPSSSCTTARVAARTRGNERDHDRSVHPG